MIRLVILFTLSFLISGCTGGKVSIYREGDLNSRTFLSHVSSDKKPKSEFYSVTRDKSGKIVSAKHYDEKRHLLEKSHYNYTRKGKLKRHRQTQ